MSKVIALDLGKVCININPEACPKALGINSINSRKEYDDLFLAHELGSKNSYDFIEELNKLSSKHLSMKDVSSIFCSIICEEIPGMSEIVCALASKGYRVCLFSDTSELHLYESLSKLSFAHLITGGVYSFETGAVKPDRQMFMEFERKYGKPVLYIDDKEMNCAGAEKYGWTAHCFDSPERLEKVVQGL